MNGIFSKAGVNTLEYSLDVLSEKDRQITYNLANKDTPMYKASKLEFKEAMASYFGNDNRIKVKLYTTNEKHIQPKSSLDSPLAFVRKQNNPSLRTDGNDVNEEYENAEFAKSAIWQTMFMEIVGNKFAGLKEVITSK